MLGKSGPFVKVASFLFVVPLVLFSPGSVAALRPSRTVEFGYIKDAAPVSHYNLGLEGYCKKLKEYIEDKGWNVGPRIIEYADRFTAFKRFDDSRVIPDKAAGIECGPSTITAKRIKDLAALKTSQDVDAKFSRPFFVTSTKLLVKKDKVSALFDRNPSEQPLHLSIGALGSTTNQLGVRAVFPNVDVVHIKDREDAIEKLISASTDGIDAYAGDEVLLISLLHEKRDDLGREFTIEPKLFGLTREEYGIVVYNSDELLQVIDNGWIGKDDRNAVSLLRNYNPLAPFLENFIAQPSFYLLLLALATGICVIVATHQGFLLMLFRLMPTSFGNRILALIRSAAVENSKPGIVSLIFNKLIDYELLSLIAYKASSRKKIRAQSEIEKVILIEKIGIQSLLIEYRKKGLSGTEAIEELSAVLGEIHQKYQANDPWLARIASEWLNVAKAQGIEGINSMLWDRINGK